MMYRIPFLAVVAVALVALAGQSLRAADEKMHEATVVKVGDGMITLSFKGDNKQHMHNVAKDAMITLDDKKSSLEELKKGFLVMVMMDDKSVVTMIDAKTKKN